MSTWYQKAFPRIKDIKPYISKIAKEIKGIDEVKSLYLWGSCHNNFDNPDFRVKDIDIIAKVDFESGDLISINEDIKSRDPSDKYLEEEGFFPAAIKFSQKYIDIAKYSVDHWAISSDKKLLHWGPILRTKEESIEIKKEAENYAEEETGYNKEKVVKSSQKIKNSWYKHHEYYINRYLSGMPSGWYQSSEEDIREILKKTRKL